MRQFVWYCPEFEALAIQCVMPDCYTAFEHDWEKLVEMRGTLNGNFNLMSDLFWIYVGEL